MRKERLELAASDDLELDLGRDRRRRENRLETVEGNQLPHKERVKGPFGPPAGPKEPVLGADETDLDLVGSEAKAPSEEGTVRLRIGDHNVGTAERAAIHEVHDARPG